MKCHNTFSFAYKESGQQERIVSSLKGWYVIIDGKKLRGENPAGNGCNSLAKMNAMVYATNNRYIKGGENTRKVMDFS